VSAKLQSLIVAYCRSLPLDVQALAETLAPPSTETDAIVDNLTAALQRVHRIKGAGGSLGFAAVSRAASQLEADLRELAEAAGEGEIEIGPVLQSLAQLKELAATVHPEGSTLYGIDLSQVAMAGRHFGRGS
jgi:HPt (histidine-containing phosphotransfer) domain-containing protein